MKNRKENKELDNTVELLSEEIRERVEKIYSSLVSVIEKANALKMDFSIDVPTLPNLKKQLDLTDKIHQKDSLYDEPKELKTLRDRLKSSRKKARLSQHELARIIGKSQSAIAAIEAGRNKESTNIAAIAEALSVDAVWLATGKGERESRRTKASYLQSTQASNLQSNPQGINAVPIISWQEVSQDLSNVNPIHTAYTVYPVKPRAYALIVEDDSMYPEFAIGDTIIIEPDSVAENGDYIISMQQNSDVNLRQLIRKETSNYLKPLNARYSLMPLNHSTICGVVKEKIKRY